MITLRLIGWEKGIQAVSLINAIREHSDFSLSQSKEMVESLLEGQIVAIDFLDSAKMHAFRRVAIDLGARCE